MISLHYTSHTKAYNTYYAQCDIVEQSTPLHWNYQNCDDFQIL